MSDELENKIINAWRQNAEPWTEAVQNARIKSRNLVTNDAILDVVRRYSPHKVLDLGCGEGWLVRQLIPYGIACVGVDAVPELITSARSAGQGDYRVMTYEDVSLESLGEQFDVVVCNFSLLGNESVAALIGRVHELLRVDGHLIIQTVHPQLLPQALRGRSGWQTETWQDFAGSFYCDSPWYYRTPDEWQALFEKSGLHMECSEEPCFPETGDPASIIMVAGKGSN